MTSPQTPQTQTPADTDTTALIETWDEPANVIDGIETWDEVGENVDGWEV